LFESTRARNRSRSRQGRAKLTDFRSVAYGRPTRVPPVARPPYPRVLERKTRCGLRLTVRHANVRPCDSTSKMPIPFPYEVIMGFNPNEYGRMISPRVHA
jgi:hypothetical protein